ncbi:hypothetical protein NEOKW01_0067 [Nematocida sp. AWRm80]|nr:hypothetical protein NEOKW01_0067 [Nematocida sp. AWRm80]
MRKNKLEKQGIETQKCAEMLSQEILAGVRRKSQEIVSLDEDSMENIDAYWAMANKELDEMEHTDQWNTILKTLPHTLSIPTTTKNTIQLDFPQTIPIDQNNNSIIDNTNKEDRNTLVNQDISIKDDITTNIDIQNITDTNIAIDRTDSTLGKQIKENLSKSQPRKETKQAKENDSKKGLEKKNSSLQEKKTLRNTRKSFDEEFEAKLDNVLLCGFSDSDLECSEQSIQKISPEPKYRSNRSDGLETSFELVPSTLQTRKDKRIQSKEDTTNSVDTLSKRVERERRKKAPRKMSFLPEPMEVSFSSEHSSQNTILADGTRERSTRNISKMKPNKPEETEEEQMEQKTQKSKRNQRKNNEKQSKANSQMDKDTTLESELTSNTHQRTGTKRKERKEVLSEESSINEVAINQKQSLPEKEHDMQNITRRRVSKKTVSAEIATAPEMSSVLKSAKNGVIKKRTLSAKETKQIIPSEPTTLRKPGRPRKTPLDHLEVLGTPKVSTKPRTRTKAAGTPMTQTKSINMPAEIAARKTNVRAASLRAIRSTKSAVSTEKEIRRVRKIKRDKPVSQQAKVRNRKTDIQSQPDSNQLNSISYALESKSITNRKILSTSAGEIGKVELKPQKERILRPNHIYYVLKGTVLVQNVPSANTRQEYTYKEVISTGTVFKAGGIFHSALTPITAYNPNRSSSILLYFTNK